MNFVRLGKLQKPKEAVSGSFSHQKKGFKEITVIFYMLLYERTPIQNFLPMHVPTKFLHV